jgi:hypothetical protein
MDSQALPILHSAILHKLLALASVVLVMAGPAVTFAQDTVSLSGYLEPEARARIGTARPEWVHSSMPDARLELRAYPTEQVDAAVVGDLNMRYADVVTPQVAADLRELWVRYYEGPLTLILGRQIHTWGTIQDFGVTDILNPQEFPDLTQDQTNRKIGMWTLKTVYDFNFMQAEVYVMPFFVPAELPMQGGFAEAALPRPLRRAIQQDASRAQQAGAEGRRQLDDARRQLQNGQAEIDAGYAQITQGQAQLDAAEADILQQLQMVAGMPEPQKSAAEAQLYAGLATIQAQRSDLHRQSATIDSAQARLEMEGAGLASAETDFARQSMQGEQDYRNALSTPQRDIPPREPRSTQAAARLYFPLSFGDFAIGGARLYDQMGTIRFQPGASPGDAPTLRIEHPRLTAWTFSSAIPLGPVGLRFEGLYLHTADPDGTDPFVRNPTLQSAAQIVWDPTSEWSIRAGIQDEQVFKLDDAGERADEYSIPSPVGSTLLLLADRIAHTAVTYRWGTSMHQLLLAYLWAYEADGHFISPEADIALVPGIRLRTGAQIFAGRGDKRGFGQLKNEDNVYVALRASF